MAANDRSRRADYVKTEGVVCFDLVTRLVERSIESAVRNPSSLTLTQPLRSTAEAEVTSEVPNNGKIRRGGNTESTCQG